ncbi:MAG: PAS domain S-box protein [Betaproteobacteria bacterium]|nr:PAS domain S-box protein [Betaproteobacteria bacterium]
MTSKAPGPKDRIPDFRRRLLAKQVDELFFFVPPAVAFSFIGSIATVLVFYDTGDLLRGLAWFIYATLVTFFRGLVALAYRQQAKPVINPAFWGRMMLIGNLLAGIQWGLIGTVLYPEGHGYRELFTVLVITSFVAGSITAFSPVKWVHMALAIPASLPPAIYIFFMQGQPNWLGGGMALFFIFCVLFFSWKQYHIVAARLIVELDNEELLKRSLESNRSLSDTNLQLRYQSESEQRAKQEARHRAQQLGTHVARTLLPVIEIDRHHNIVEWNEAAEKTLGFRFNEVSGQRLTSLLLPAERMLRDRPALEHSFGEDRASSIDTVMQTKRGTRMPAHLYITPMRVEDGVPVRVGVIAIFMAGGEEDFANAA